jgi:hypothetical protein
MPQMREKFPPATKNLHYHGFMSRDPDGDPPFLGSWNRVYTAILAYLGAVIAAFYAFTRAYR